MKWEIFQFEMLLWISVFFSKTSSRTWRSTRSRRQSTQSQILGCMQMSAESSTPTLVDPRRHGGWRFLCNAYQRGPLRTHWRRKCEFAFRSLTLQLAWFPDVAYPSFNSNSHEEFFSVMDSILKCSHMTHIKTSLIFENKTAKHNTHCETVCDLRQAEMLL